jgi:hypothetical protein
MQTNIMIEPDRLVAFFLETVSQPTALNYIKEIRNAKTPFITVERREDDKFNIIGGFKYISGFRQLNNNTKILCNIVDPFKSDKDRKLAILQRCLMQNEYNIKYKEILIHELIQKYKMNEKSISNELGQSTDKIIKYMYKQIIPKSYYDFAERLGIKPLIQAIFLANPYSSHEKLVLTELSLGLRFMKKHMAIYNKYRKNYSLFDDISMAKKQVLNAINTEQATIEYWESIPHPYSYTISERDLNENNKTH